MSSEPASVPHEQRAAELDERVADTPAVDEFDGGEQEWLLGPGDADLDWDVPSRRDLRMQRLAQIGAVMSRAAATTVVVAMIVLQAARRTAASWWRWAQPEARRAWAWLLPKALACAQWLERLARTAWNLTWSALSYRLFTAFPRWSGDRIHLRGAKMRPLALIVTLCLLLACILPSCVTIAGALNDYHALRALGESGLQHLLAAKQDLAGLADSLDLTELPQALVPSAAPTSRVPYTYMVQRQAGTAYAMTVTIHPSPAMAAEGISDARLQPTVDANTALMYGVASPPASGGSTPGNSGRVAPRTEQITHPSRADTLRALSDDLQGAQSDFTQLSQRVGHPDWVLHSTDSIPQTRGTMASVAAMAEIGNQLATTGLTLLHAATPILSRMNAGALSSQRDLLTPTNLDTLQRALIVTLQSLDIIQARMAKIDLRQLPLSPDQLASLSHEIQELPQLKQAAQLALTWLPAVGWLLGVGQPRSFLVQTLDRSELRSSGGFTGDYGVLTLTNGRLDPFTLNNVNDIEYGYKSNGWIYGKKAPQEYSWWPFGNFGLRDSNLSADFPTTARMNIQLFHDEGGGDVDGVIQVSPAAIAGVLRVTGPIAVPGYNETVTADNLEDRIHYYQQDPAGIAKEQQLNPDDHTHSLRKRFTQLVTQLLLDKVKQLGESQMLQLARQLVDDLKSKDVQIYVTDAQIETLLENMHAAGAMVTTPGVDTYMLVQANVSVAKSTPYVQVTQTDDVTLDDQGGATHRLTLTLKNAPTGPIYGWPTYRDYLRIYVPAAARFASGWGFDQMDPMCYTPSPAPPAPPPAPATGATGTGAPGSSTPPPAPPGPPPPPPQYTGLPTCSASPYSSSERVCPAGYYAYDGEASKVLGWGDGKVPALDAIGPPTSATSDLPGFAMRGGYVVIPQFCSARVTLKWYVPGVAHAPPHARAQAWPISGEGTR